MSSTTESNYKKALSRTTAEEQTYMSNPTKKNYTWLIATATVLIIAGAAWYFYKH